ncbi:hypothetical protein C8J57DRAFT_1526310 [Mycena rebaudengoi]|nr:hypothetical protein C8J57DRAFT_1526310 [Mycena rebaudengoi]
MSFNGICPTWILYLIISPSSSSSKNRELLTPLALPLEITAEIFKWCFCEGLRLLPSVVPLLLTQICHDWRTLALSTPALWDTITEIEFNVPEQSKALVTTWFSRTGTRPLSLGFIYPPHPESAHLEFIIRRHASQLQCLHIVANSNVFSDLSAIQPFPVLRDLTLCSLDHLEPDGTQIPLFRGAPLLRHLSLEGLPPSALVMPWAQLTKLTASLISLQECLGVLRLATLLYEFCRQGPPEEGEEESVLGALSVCHPSLNSLAVSASDGDQDILHFLALPGLQKLKLGGRFTKWTSDLDADVVQFLSRVCATLRIFTVGMSPTVPGFWFRPLTHLTTLELIRPVGLEFTTDVIRALDRRNAPDLLPKLQNFVYSDCGSDQVDKELLNALSSRCGPSDAARVRLQSFSLIWLEFDYPDAPITPSLEDIADEITVTVEDFLLWIMGGKRGEEEKLQAILGHPKFATLMANYLPRPARETTYHISI